MRARPSPMEIRGMRNLAGNIHCDEFIRAEFRTAGVDIVVHERRLLNEVPATVTGELGGGEYVFVRGWYYWVVRGKVPLRIAREMYTVEERRDVRVDGHCMSPSPEDHAEPSLKELRRICEDESKDPDHMFEMLKDTRTVNLYHIDSQEGLNFFVTHLKKGDSQVKRYDA